MAQTLDLDANLNHPGRQRRGTNVRSPAGRLRREETSGPITVNPDATPNFTPKPYDAEPGASIRFKAEGSDSIQFHVSREGGGRTLLFTEPPPYFATRAGNTYTVRSDASPGVYVLSLRGPAMSDTDDGEIRVGSGEDDEE